MLAIRAFNSPASRQALRAAPRAAATWAVYVSEQQPRPNLQQRAAVSNPPLQNRCYSTAGDRVAQYKGTKDSNVRFVFRQLIDFLLPRSIPPSWVMGWPEGVAEIK